MGFSPYTQPQRGAEYLPPVSLDLILKGAEYKQQNAERGMQQTNAELDHLASLPTLPGRDTEIKNEKIKALTDSMKGLAIQELGNAGVQSKIHGNIAKLTNDPDFQAVVSKGMTMQSEQKKMDDFAEKGKTYISPALEALQDYAKNYSSQGKYLRNIDMGSSGFLAPDNGALMKQVKEIARATEVNVTDKYGNTHVEKNYKPEDLRQALDVVVGQNPNYSQYQDYQFKKLTKGANWTEEAQKKFTPHIEAEQEIINQATSGKQLTKDPNRIKYFDDVIKQSTDNITYYNDLLTNPHTENEVRNALYQNQLSEEKSKMVAAMSGVQESENKLDERVKLGIQLQNDIYSSAVKSITPGLLSLGLSPQQIATGQIPATYTAADGSTRNTMMDAQAATTRIEAQSKQSESINKTRQELNNLLTDVSKGVIGTEWLESTLDTYSIPTPTSTGGMSIVTAKEAIDNSVPPVMDKDGMIHYKVRRIKYTPKTKDSGWFNWDGQPEKTEEVVEDRTKSIYEVLDKYYKSKGLVYSIDALKGQIENAPGNSFQEKLKYVQENSRAATQAAPVTPSGTKTNSYSTTIGGKTYDYTEAEIVAAAQKANKTVDEYIKLKGLTKK